MPLIRPSTLLLATAISGTAIYRAVLGDLDPTTAMTRFLIAVPVSGLMLAAMRSVTASYRRRLIETAPVRAEDKVVQEPEPE